MEPSPIDRIFIHHSDQPPIDFLMNGCLEGEEWKAEGAEMTRAEWLWSRRPSLWATSCIIRHTRKFLLLLGASAAVWLVPVLIYQSQKGAPLWFAIGPVLFLTFLLRVRYEERWRKDYARALYRVEQVG
jgi:hypothetical protein